MKLYLILFILCTVGFQNLSLAGPKTLLLEDQTPESAKPSSRETSKQRLFETEDIMDRISQMDPGVMDKLFQSIYSPDCGAAAINLYKNRVIKLVKKYKFRELSDADGFYLSGGKASYQIAWPYIKRDLWQMVMRSKPSHLLYKHEVTWDSDLTRLVHFEAFGDTEEEERALEQHHNEIKKFEKKLNQIMAGRGCVYFTDSNPTSGDSFALELRRKCF